MRDAFNSHAIRKIVLPSGRTVEVIRPNGPAARPLDVCPHCDCNLVQPITWSEREDRRWKLVLECPNCNWQEQGIYERAQIDELEVRLQDGLAELSESLRAATKANMVDDLHDFVAALEADFILPEDF